MCFAVNVRVMCRCVRTMYIAFCFIVIVKFCVMRTLVGWFMFLLDHQELSQATQLSILVFSCQLNIYRHMRVREAVRKHIHLYIENSPFLASQPNRIQTFFEASVKSDLGKYAYSWPQEEQVMKSLVMMKEQQKVFSSKSSAVFNQTRWSQFSIDGKILWRRKLIISFFSQNIFAKKNLCRLSQ